LDSDKTVSRTQNRLLRAAAGGAGDVSYLSCLLNISRSYHYDKPCIKNFKRKIIPYKYINHFFFIIDVLGNI